MSLARSRSPDRRGHLKPQTPSYVPSLYQLNESPNPVYSGVTPRGPNDINPILPQQARYQPPSGLVHSQTLSILPEYHKLPSSSQSDHSDRRSQFERYGWPMPPESAYSSHVAHQHLHSTIFRDFTTPDIHRLSHSTTHPDGLRRSHFGHEYTGGLLPPDIREEGRISGLPSTEYASATVGREARSEPMRSNVGSPPALSPVVWEHVSRISHEHPSSLRYSNSSNRSPARGHEEDEMELASPLEEGREEKGGQEASALLRHIGAHEAEASVKYMLPNRDYYPLPHHQAQFDALYRQNKSIIKEREVLGLNSLDGEPGMPPLYSMPIIIECAILGSPHQKLTLAELRLTLKKRFGYYEKEEEKGVKSWERTLLQNLSKKSRFVHLERPMSEPGQGGYWKVDHSGPPPNRARKRNTKRIESSLHRNTTPSLSTPATFQTNDTTSESTGDGNEVSTRLDGPSSLFRSVPADSVPGGRVSGMNDRCIVLPSLNGNGTEIFPSSPRHWTGSMANTLQPPSFPGSLFQRDNFNGRPASRTSQFSNESENSRIVSAHPHRCRGNAVARRPLQRT